MNKITDKQRSFMLSLLNERSIPEDGDTDLLWKKLRISEDPEEFGMSSREASEYINWLLTQPRKQVEQATNDARAKLPPGRYAIENEEGELRFYQLWASKDGKRKSLYVLYGPSNAKLFPKTQESICQKILDAGFRECAIRFGHEIGACSNCGRRLTNRISRELGIGPICGGRMFNGSWADEVKAARARIIAAGLDPDEELTDEQVKKLSKLKKLYDKMQKRD